MNNEENIKNNLNEKLNSFQFSMEENDWLKAAAFIDAKRKRRKLIILFFSFLPLIGGLLYWTLLPSSEQNKNISSIVNAPNVEVLADLSPAKKEIETPEILNNNSSTIQKEIPKQELTPIAINTKKEKTNDKIVTPTKSNISITNAENPIVSNENVLQSNPETIKQNVSQIKEEIAEKAVIEPVVKELYSSNSNVVKSENANLNKEPIANLVPEKQNETKVAEPKSENLPQTIIENSKKENENPRPIVAPVITKSEMKQDTNLVFVTPNSSTPEITNTVIALITNSLFVEIGGLYNFGWTALNIREGNSLSPLFGINFVSQIKNKIGLSIGIQYYNVHQLSVSNRTSKIVNYRFGEESDVTVITPNKLHYLNIPVKMEYQLNTRNAFAVGANVAYLLNVDSKIETYSESNEQVSDYKTYSLSGYTQGFQMFDTQLGMAYRRKVWNKFWLNSELYFGLKDIKNNDFFELKKYERNFGLKISLNYNIYNK